MSKLQIADALRDGGFFGDVPAGTGLVSFAWLLRADSNTHEVKAGLRRIERDMRLSRSTVKRATERGVRCQQSSIGNWRASCSARKIRWVAA